MMPPSLSVRLETDYAVALATAIRPLAVSALAPEAHAYWRNLKSEKRRSQWLRGRCALARLFPLPAEVATRSKRFSVSHCRGLSVAAAVAESELSGVGVDVEANRPVNPAIARFFLSAGERRSLEGLSPREVNERILRLWTIKEAVYKATPDNSELVLADIRIADPGSRAGWAAVAKKQGVAVGYTSACDGRHFVSVAVSREAARD